jgi:hypothetical protein
VKKVEKGDADPRPNLDDFSESQEFHSDDSSSNSSESSESRGEH